MFKNMLRNIIFFAVIGISILSFFLISNHHPSNADENLTKVVQTQANERKENQSENNQVKESKKTNEPSPQMIVDVKGAVKHPGVYHVTSGERVNDVIKSAGGFMDNANKKAVNLAQHVQDEMVIRVPVIGDGDGGDVDITANENAKININKATAEEIETLNGIGPAKAKAIIQYREENGMFHKKEDLLNVAGIGEKTLANFADDIQVP